jgi:hypothetical protein
MSSHTFMVKAFFLTVLSLVFSFFQFSTFASDHKLSVAEIDRYELWPKSHDWDIGRVSISYDWESTTRQILAGIHKHDVSDERYREMVEQNESYYAHQASRLEAQAKSGDILSEIRDKVAELSRLQLDKLVDVIVDKEGILYLHTGTPLTDLTAQIKPVVDKLSPEAPPDLTLLARTKPARVSLKLGFANLPLIKFMVFRPSAEFIYRMPLCLQRPRELEGTPAEFPCTFEFLRSLRTSDRHWPQVYECMSKWYDKRPAETCGAWAAWATRGMDEEKTIRDVIARIGHKKRLDLILDITEVYVGDSIVRNNGQDVTDDVVAELRSQT